MKAAFKENTLNLSKTGNKVFLVCFLMGQMLAPAVSTVEIIRALIVYKGDKKCTRAATTEPEKQGRDAVMEGFLTSLTTQCSEMQNSVRWVQGEAPPHAASALLSCKHPKHGAVEEFVQFSVAV